MPHFCPCWPRRANLRTTRNLFELCRRDPTPACRIACALTTATPAMQRPDSSSEARIFPPASPAPEIVLPRSSRVRAGLGYSLAFIGTAATLALRPQMDPALG